MIEDYTPMSMDLKGSFLLVGLNGYEGEGKISIWEIGKEMKKMHEILDNGSGVNKVIYD